MIIMALFCVALRTDCAVADAVTSAATRVDDFVSLLQ